MRPEGWLNPYWQPEGSWDIGGIKAGVPMQAYEAGGDAMLEGLKKEGIAVGYDNWGVDIDTVALREKISGKGYLVFIEGEKDAV